ncbi:hypothetical protein GCM10009821_03700 [Aeromicrobium halocynthiae]|uniref:DUF5666 domain-containing protein n=1 Tax=Aeromicrobium halocynthiae TaxID=560557 RepID=A0ABP5HA92_9ACTN
MTEEDGTGRPWSVGDIENGYILTAAGWVQLRKRAAERGPEHGGPPWVPGDVVNGHVYIDEAWMPIGERGRSAPLQQPPQNLHEGADEKTDNWFTRLPGLGRAAVIGGAVVLLALFATSGPDAAGPEEQDEFVSIVASGQDRETENDTQVVAAKRERGEALCELLPSSLAVEDWRGTLTSITTELAGDDGVVKIEISENVEVVSVDIEPDSEVFSQITSLKEGTRVTFSGEFEDAGDQCIYERSLGSANGLRTPDFGIELSSIE